MRAAKESVREQRGSTIRQCKGVAGGSLKWVLSLGLELPSLAVAKP